MAPRGFFRRAVSVVLYLFYLVVFVLAFHYLVFWRSYAGAMRARAGKEQSETAAAKLVGRKLARALGSVRNTKDTSFVKASRIKRAGVTRVCAIGDSFALGSEVDDHLDYPTLLQGLFRDRGRSDVEVINFGNGWHGFHQTFLLWDEFVRHYACDYLLLGPGGFFRERDVTFNHSGMRVPSYLHSRYILDGDDVRLLKPIGENWNERLDNFLRFFPRWQYWRYDRNPPPVVLAALPPEKTVPNPFYYYDGSLQEEALATYRILWRKMAESGSRIFLVHPDKELTETAKRLDLPNLEAFPLEHSYAFPNLAPQGHFSAFGNRVVAEHFYAHVTKEPVKAPFLATAGLPRQSTVEKLPEDAPVRPLWSFRKIGVVLRDQLIGGFHCSGSERVRNTIKPTLAEEKVVGLLGLSNDNRAATDNCYVPVPFPLRSGMKLSLGPRSSTERAEIGSVTMVDRAINVGLADDRLGCKCRDRVICRRRSNLKLAEGETSLFVDDIEVLRGMPSDDGLVLTALHGRSRIIGVIDTGYVDPDSLPDEGTFDLAAFGPRRILARAPLAKWSKVMRPIPGESDLTRAPSE